MSASSPFDDDEVAQPAAELPADDLKDNSHRAEAVQSLRRTSQAQPDNPVEMQVKDDDLAQRAADAMAIPVPEAESVEDAGLQAQQMVDDERAQQVEGISPAQLHDEGVTDLAAQPVQEDDVPQRADEATALPVPQTEDVDDARLLAQQVVPDEGAQRIDEINATQHVDEDETRLNAQPIQEGDAAQQADEPAGPPAQDIGGQRIEDAQAALRTGEEDTLRFSQHERFADLAEHIEELTGRHDRSSPSDYEGHTPEENVELAEEMDRVERSELHHSVMVFMLRAIESSGVKRDPASINSQGGEGFRQLVDDHFPQQLIEMDRMVHDDLHRELNQVLDDMLEHERANLDDAPQKIVERGGARAMMERLEELTGAELMDVLEDAYRRVFSQNPDLVSGDDQAQTLKAIDDVRETLRHFGPGRRRQGER